MSILFDGLSLGAIYALIALGYTMVYGIAKMLNFAHGDIIMVGAYAFYVALISSGHMALGIVVAVIFCTVMGMVVEKVAYKPLRGASPLAVLITAIGVSYLLQSISQLVFGADPKVVTIPSLGTVSLLGASISVSSIITLLIGAVIMAGLTVFVKKTRTGRAMVAVSEDKGAAMLMGINVDKIITITFAIGSALAACASVFYLMQIPSVEPTLGSMPGIKAFTAAVIGGIGSIPGAVVGAFIIGICENLVKATGYTMFSDAFTFLLLIIILCVKPTGIFGEKNIDKV